MIYIQKIQRDQERQPQGFLSATVDVLTRSCHLNYEPVLKGHKLHFQVQLG